jgi:hypothetical protein
MKLGWLFSGYDILFVDIGNGCLIELQHGALGDFDHHGVLFHIMNDAVDA